MRLKVRSRVDLPQPDGPMKAVTLLLGDVEVDVLQRLEAAVVEVEVAHRELGLLGQREIDFGVHAMAFSVRSRLRKKMRARMFSSKHARA